MRVAIQIEKKAEHDSLKAQLIQKYPGEKLRYLYAKAFIIGMKKMIGEK